MAERLQKARVARTGKDPQTGPGGQTFLPNKGCCLGRHVSGRGYYHHESTDQPHRSVEEEKEAPLTGMFKAHRIPCWDPDTELPHGTVYMGLIFMQSQNGSFLQLSSTGGIGLWDAM